MISISEEDFESLINQAMASLPKEHTDHIKNVAILYENDPSPEQRSKLELSDSQTLFGLYEGIPLSRRQGMPTTLPDKITLFKNPLQYSVQTLPELKEQIRHTLWHEIAHYYGLNHDQIGKLEK